MSNARARQFERFLLAIVLPTAAAFAQSQAKDDFRIAINQERRYCVIPPIEMSPALSRLAQQRAAEIGAAGVLDFEPLGGDELLARGAAYGYSGRLIQELVAVADDDPCEIVERWNESLPAGEAYRRQEVRDMGAGESMLGEQAVHVLIVGVPLSEDPLRKRNAGVAPREHLTAELFNSANEGRRTLGLPPLARDSTMDSDAQRIAYALLADPRIAAGAGVERHADDVDAVYFKGAGLNVARPDLAAFVWFKQERVWLLTSGSPAVGVGLSTRGLGDQVEAVWVLVIRRPEASSAQQLHP